MTLARLVLIGLIPAALFAIAGPAAAQGTVFTWNNSNTNWNAAGSWNPSGPPGPPAGNSNDIVQFNVVGTFGTATINDPTWTSAPANFGSLILAPTAQFTGWTFAGGGSVQEFNLSAYGPATYTFSGPSVQDTAAGNGVTLNIGYGSTIALSGNGTANARTFAINLNGGTLRLDNRTTNLSDRVALFALSTGGNFNSSSGTIDFIGNANGSTETIEKLTLNPGYTRINVENHSASAPTVLTFDALARNGNGIVNFANTGPTGQLGASGNNPRIMLTGQAAGFIGQWAVANGTDFAVYDSTNGVRAATSADYAQTYTTTIGTNLTQGQYGALNQDAGTANVTWSGSAGAGTGSFLRISPSANSQSLTFALSAGNNVNLNAIVLAGSRNYTISGIAGVSLTGTGAAFRHFGVLDANATLTFNLPIAFASGWGIVKSGDGILDLTANMSGAGLIGGTASSTSMYLTGGVLRVNTNPTGSFPSGSGQLVNFRGGVLELTGTAPSFTRALGTGAGQVNWFADSSNHGSGGFSAFGSANASVNIGGAGGTLTWASGNFVANGEALLFGSIKSNRMLTWVNPINLNAPANGSYVLREISVTRGAGNLDDLTRITGAISGATNADLIKTGAGVLELTAPNSYQGNTLVQNGTLIVSGSLGVVGTSRTGNVVVGSGAILAGSGTILPDQSNPSDFKSVIVNPGGAIRGGSPVTNSLTDHTGTLTVSSAVTINSSAVANGTLQFEPHKIGPGTATASKLVLGLGFNLNLNPGLGNRFALELVTSSATTPLDLNQPYTLVLASVGPTGHIQLNGANLAGGATIDHSNFVLTSSSYSFDPNYSLQVSGSDVAGYDLTLSFTLTPVPEPAAILGLAVVALGAGALAGRVRYHLS